MPDVQTFRPVSTGVAGAWTPEPSGTLHGVTSDNSDTTYAAGTVINDGMLLGCGSHTPPSDHQRHRWRARVRASGGIPNPRLRWFATGPAIFPATSPAGNVLVPATPIATYTAAWGFFADPQAAGSFTVQFLTAMISGAGVAVYEAYVDVDSRSIPTFTAVVLDGAGNSQNGGTVTDTTVPRFVFDGVNYDGLPARDWQLFVYTLGQTLAGGFVPFATTPFRQVTGVGAAPSGLPFTNVGPLDNGQYVAYFRTSSTIRGSTPFVSAVQSVGFTMDVDTPPRPVLTVTVQAPDAEVCWTPDTPTGTDWDNPDEIVIEVQRSDCFRDFFEVHIAHTPLTGCFIDRFVPLFDDCAACDEDQDEFNCEVIYRARYWGMVGGILMSTDWSAF